MTIQAVVFYLLAAMVILPAIFVVTAKNVFHSALMLILSLLGVGGMYAMLAADFVFAIQLLVYAGGVMVILLFIVLLSGQPADWTGTQVNERAWLAGLASLSLIAILGAVIYSWPIPVQAPNDAATTSRLGDLLLKTMVLPFEVISLVLVASLVGAVFFSGRKAS